MLNNLAIIAIILLAIPESSQRAIFQSQNASSSTTCLSFYPQDIYVNMNGQTAGTTATLVRLNAATDFGSATGAAWTDIASGGGTFGASIVTLPASVAITGGPTHTCNFATQAFFFNGTTTFSAYELDPPSGTFKELVVSGWYTLPPSNSSAIFYDQVQALGLVKPYTATLQTNPGNTALTCAAYAVEIETGGAGPTRHSGCITGLTPGGTYFYSMHANWSATGTCAGAVAAPCAEAALYTTSGTTFTQVGSTVSVIFTASTDSFGGMRYGNEEAGSFVGHLTYQHMMIDYTNHVFPNLPH